MDSIKKEINLIINRLYVEMVCQETLMALLQCPKEIKEKIVTMNVEIKAPLILLQTIDKLNKAGKSIMENIGQGVKMTDQEMNKDSLSLLVSCLLFDGIASIGKNIEKNMSKYGKKRMEGKNT